MAVLLLCVYVEQLLKTTRLIRPYNVSQIHKPATAGMSRSHLNDSYPSHIVRVQSSHRLDPATESINLSLLNFFF